MKWLPWWRWRALAERRAELLREVLQSADETWEELGHDWEVLMRRVRRHLLNDEDAP